MRWLERAEEGLVALLLAAMTVLTFAQVVARLFFGHGLPWAPELTSVLFAWLIFLGIPYGVRVGSHMAVDALVRALGPNAGRVAGIAAASLCVVYSAILLVGSGSYVARAYDTGLAMDELRGVPIWVPRAILVACFALLLARFAQVLYRIILGHDIRLHLSDEAEELLREKREARERRRAGRRR